MSNNGIKKFLSENLSALERTNQLETEDLKIQVEKKILKKSMEIDRADPKLKYI